MSAFGSKADAQLWLKLIPATGSFRPTAVIHCTLGDCSSRSNQGLLGMTSFAVCTGTFHT